jgi:hypothetical protein
MTRNQRKALQEYYLAADYQSIATDTYFSGDADARLFNAEAGMEEAFGQGWAEYLA